MVWGLGSTSAFVEKQSEGPRVVIANWNAESGAGVADSGEIQQLGGNALFQRTDVSKSTDCAAMVAAVMKQYAVDCDVIFANAGIELGQQGRLHRMTRPKRCGIASTASYLPAGCGLSCNVAAQQMLTQGHGSIVVPAARRAGITGCAPDENGL